MNNESLKKDNFDLNEENEESYINKTTKNKIQEKNSTP